ncbi:hypothetical protein DPMN_138372 [Dreissena polymorpha]|uniref:Uncharacterized protein n=1 Tax=Dreissena polymorpha TaxID=45954 RepID=A0A9D4JFJ9_DREPO|nr:hypothetical protein DPMN_138372 [Dreissena polymorpha]
MLKFYCWMKGYRITWRKPHLPGMVTINNTLIRLERESNHDSLGEYCVYQPLR